jgi:hypothetical protein
MSMEHPWNAETVVALGRDFSKKKKKGKAIPVTGCEGP